MEIIIKCGGDDCAKEFKASTDKRTWTCPNCEHVVVNPNYPFLSARLMAAKSREPGDTDWQELLDFILRTARAKMLENNMYLRENDLEPLKLSLLIEYEEKLDKKDQDWQSLVLEAVDKLGEQIKDQEDRIEKAT